jgi:hypothetical protein
VLHQIGGDEIDPLRISDQRFERGPLRVELDAVVGPREALGAARLSWAAKDSSR